MVSPTSLATSYAEGEPGHRAWGGTVAEAVNALTRIAARTVYVTEPAYGAAGNSSAAGVGTDDTAAITAAVAAAAAMGPRTRLVFPPPVAGAAGYKVTSTVTVPGGVDVEMHAPIVYSGTGPALVVGEAGSLGAKANARHLIRVRRSSISDWSSESLIGVKLINPYWAQIDLAEAYGFTIGAQFMGDGYGAAYCTVLLGQIRDNKIGLDLTNANSGWSNQNTFIGGSFMVTSTTNTTVDRTGIRITSADGTYTQNNKITFESPSFELRTGSFTSTCLDVVHGGPGVEVRSARCESVDPVVAVTRNDSRPIRFDAAYDGGATLSISEVGTFRGSLLTQESTRLARAAAKPVFRADGLHKRACYYSSSLIHVPDLGCQTNATSVNEARGGTVAATTGLTLHADYLIVGTNRMLGRYVSTVRNKRFAVAVDAESGYGGRYMVRCHDASGAVLSAAGTVQTSDSGAFSYATTFGGAWGTGLDGTGLKFFTVSDATAYMFVGVRGGTAEARIRSLTVYCLDGESSSWLPWDDAGRNHGTEAPTAGTWEVGRRVINAAPAASGTEGWVCVTAGSPGTWKTFGTIGA